MVDGPVVIRPGRMKVLGSEGAGTFVLVTNPGYENAFAIEPSDRYERTKIVTFTDGQRFQDLLAREVPEDSHVLTIMPDCLLHSIPASDLGRRKLLIMACRSGRTDLDGIAHFLAAGEETDPDEQQAFSDRFFAVGEGAEALEIVDDDYGTSARFNHLHDEYEWHEQLGVVEWGGQQVYPAGEIACFLVPLKAGELDQRTFDVDGRLALRGRLIVQSGPPSFLVEDQERIYRRLATMEEHAVLVDVKQGDVAAVEASDPTCRPAAEMLETLFEVDSRFGRIYEFGFAFNRWATPWPGNCAMNEVYGGPGGQLHVGLGMLPHTQYHIDVFLKGTRVLGKDGRPLVTGLVAADRPRMSRQKAAMCPCMVAV